MTLDIALVFALILAAVILFVTEWLRMDVTALLVVAVLSVSGILSPVQAFAGFSSPAVVTIAGMFVISASLARTGVASMVGRQLLRLAGHNETRLILTIMVMAGLLSSVMANIGVVAMMLPVVMDMSRRTRLPASLLLLPLVLGAHLGGMTTLIGTPPNLLASEALSAAGLPPLELLDFTLPGVVLLLAGTAFVGLIGARWLPRRDVRGEAGEDADLAAAFNLHERIFMVRLPPRSPLDGKVLAASRLGSALGLHVLALLREGETSLSPTPETVLAAGDRLVVQGRPDLLRELRNRRHLRLEADSLVDERLASADVGLAQAAVPDDSELVGTTLLRSDFRHRYGVIVLALKREGKVRRTQLERIRIEAGDVLLLQGHSPRLEELEASRDFADLHAITPADAKQRFLLEERFLSLRVNQDSLLANRTLAETRLGDAAGLTVLGIIRDGGTQLLPAPDEKFQPEDVLLIKAHPDDLAVLRGLQRLEIDTDSPTPLASLESDHIGLMEVVLAPRSSLVGKALREIGFREKYGLSVLAVWRGERAYRSNLRDMPIRFGDALLVFGPREKLKLLSREPDFLVLTEAGQDPPLMERAPVSVLVLAGMLLPVMFGAMHISVAVVLGAVAMVLTRCVSAEEAYRAIAWPAIILIAGMLPLGTALTQTGGAVLLADLVLNATDGFGPRGVLAGLCLTTALAAQLIPAAAAVVVMAPIAVTAAATLGLSPHALILGVALSSASLASPVSHPANVLIMGPGGYRYADYLRLGVPLALIVLALIVLVLPIFMPLVP